MAQLGSGEEADVEVEYVYEPPPDDELSKNFASVFEKFAKLNATNQTNQTDQEEQVDSQPSTDELALVEHEQQNRLQPAETAQDDAQDNGLDKKPSKRRLKEMTRMTVAELKQKVERPELVESHDITARDPLFLLHLKSTKNSVPVPRHWNAKRRYLQGKRGYEKPPFQLPDFIRQTGIMEMRDSVNEKDSAKSLKAKARDKMLPKMNKIAMDYQQLHDAFFKWQTKPKLSIHGDLYYEGKEFERKFKKKPGELSNELRRALGMPTGANAHRYPPPWLSAMKRHGPPPAYPHLRIPGVNCPFSDEPEGAGDDNHGAAFETETNASDD